MKYRELISKEFIWVLFISVPGALLADSFNIPLAWFLGPMLFTSLASLLGLQLRMPRIILSLIFVFIVFYKSLNKSSFYKPKSEISKIPQFFAKNFSISKFIHPVGSIISRNSKATFLSSPSGISSNI